MSGNTLVHIQYLNVPTILVVRIVTAVLQNYVFICILPQINQMDKHFYLIFKDKAKKARGAGNLQRC